MSRSHSQVSMLPVDWSVNWTVKGAVPSVYPARDMAQVEPDHIDGKMGFYSFAVETADGLMVIDPLPSWIASARS